MPFGVKKEAVGRENVVFRPGVVTAPGGFVLDKTGLTDGYVLPAGTVIGFDESTRKAVVIKTVRLQANAADNATQYRVVKGGAFKQGDTVAAVPGGVTANVSGVSTANADYDQLTLSATLGVALPAGSVLFLSSGAAGATTAAFAKPRGLLYNDTLVETNADLAVVQHGVVYHRRIPGVPDAIKAVLPQIEFSESY